MRIWRFPGVPDQGGVMISAHSWRWTCSACGRSHVSDRVPLPIYCLCGAIDADGRGLMALDADQLVPPLPPVAARARHVSIATARWLAAGCPVRSDEQASQLYRDHCGRPCEWLVDGTCRHPKCGCRIVDPQTTAATGGEQLVEILSAGLWNKLKWGTEVCPAGYWS